MVLNGMRRSWLLGVLASSGLWLASPDVDACSCLSGARLNWPGGRANVPLDTSVIISGFGSFADAQQSLVPPTPTDAGQGAPVAPDGGVADEAPLPPIEHPVGLHLISPAGKIVELVLERTLPTVDCTSKYQFFRQLSGELEASTSYQIYEGQTFVATFTTGTQRRDVDAEIAEAEAVRFETLGTTEIPSRITTAYVSDVPSVLAFVHYVGAQQEVTYLMDELTGNATPYDFGALACPVVEILGMDGAVLDERTLCEPDRCMGLPESVSISSCGGNHMLGVTYDEFKQLPACTGIADGGNAPSPADASVPDPASTSNMPSGDDSQSSDNDSSSMSGEERSTVGEESSTGSDASTPVDASSERPIDNAIGANRVPLDESSRDDGGCSVSGVGTAKAWIWLTGVAFVGLRARRKRRLTCD